LAVAVHWKAVGDDYYGNRSNQFPDFGAPGL